MGSHWHKTDVYELRQCVSLPWGTVFQEQTTPAWVPHGVTSPARKPALVWALLSSLHGSTGPARSLLQHGLSKGSQPPSSASTCSGVGSSMGCRVDICSIVDLHEFQGNSLLHHGLYNGLQENLCSGASTISSLSFFTDLCVCRAVPLT